MGLIDQLKKLFGLDSEPSQNLSPTPAKPQIDVTITTHAATPDELEAQRLEKVEKIRKLDSSAYLSKNGLTPSEILLLSHAGGCRTDNNAFPRFWFYDYGINDPQVILDKLFSKGMIQIASAKESLVLADYREIQSKLKSLGLPATGKKEILIERLASAVSPEELEQITTSRMYVLTDLGKTEVAQNEYIPYLHEHVGLRVSIWEINRQLHERPGSQWRDCVWAELNKAALESGKGVFGTNYRSLAIAKENMVKFLMSEKKYRQALAIAAECSYYRMNHDAIDQYLFRAKEYKPTGELQVHVVKDYSTGKYRTNEDHNPPRLFEEVTPAPYQEKAYREIKSGLGIDGDELWRLLVDTLKDFCTATDVFSADELADIIAADLSSDGELIVKICADAEEKIGNKTKNQQSRQSLQEVDPELATKLNAQDTQLQQIQNAEAQYAESGDIDALILFWETLWKNGGLLFNGSKWTFRLPDLYIEQKQYDKALRILKKIKKPQYQDKVQRYVEKIEKAKNRHGAATPKR